MKKLCKSLMFAIALVLSIVPAVDAKEKAPEVAVVSVVGEGVGNGGRPLLTVTCSAKKADKVTELDLRREAVRAVLFRGWTDKSNTNAFDASTNHPALTAGPDQEAVNADYYRDFLTGENVVNYVDLVPDTRRVMKAGKDYHVSQTVTVNLPALRKKLEKDGMVKSLKSGW